MMTSVVFVGMFFGSGLWGKMSDRYGRRTVSPSFSPSLTVDLDPQLCLISIIHGPS